MEVGEFDQTFSWGYASWDFCWWWCCPGNGLYWSEYLLQLWLFLFFIMVVGCWCDHCKQLGVKLLHKCDSKLCLWETFTIFINADDAAIMAPIKDSIVMATVKSDKMLRACGLNISIPKTKFLVGGRNITLIWTLLPLVVVILKFILLLSRVCGGVPWWC